MKKKILLLTLFTLLLMPITTLADSKTVEYKTMNLTETLEAEDIELKYEDYKETDKQVTIYLFRGNGCAYCRNFLNFLNDISEEYGKYFKLESYEVWSDKNNQELLEGISGFLGQDAGGVPYIIIGDQAFAGYSNQYDDSIKDAIKSEYDKKEKYDVIEEYEKAKEKAEKEAFFSSGKFLVSVNIAVVAIATLITILFVNYKVNVLTNKIEELKALNNKESVKSKEIKDQPKQVKTKKTQKQK